MSEGVPTAAAPKSLAACLDSLNNDCWVNVISCLSTEEMIYVAMVNRSCREAKSSDSRTGGTNHQKVLRRGATFHLICNTIIRGEWSTTFANNRTYLKIENIDNVHLSFTSTDEGNLASLARLDGVDFLTCLTKQSLETHPIHSLGVRTSFKPKKCEARFELLLNLKSVKFDNVSASVVGAIDIFQRLSQFCPKVKFYFLDWFPCMH
jgi:hypothetical protein|mmetsp:Transcript_6780/g.12407  ORF Transcript_6780/g.12407 Transcript_6780/m.12407 type:complete len:207 (-) Transcript_6780:610-1230(-)